MIVFSLWPFTEGAREFLGILFYKGTDDLPKVPPPDTNRLGIRFWRVTSTQSIAVDINTIYLEKVQETRFEIPIYDFKKTLSKSAVAGTSLIWWLLYIYKTPISKSNVLWWNFESFPSDIRNQIRMFPLFSNPKHSSLANKIQGLE